jgi:hypothetical protein
MKLRNSLPYTVDVGLILFQEKVKNLFRIIIIIIIIIRY